MACRHRWRLFGLICYFTSRQDQNAILFVPARLSHHLACARVVASEAVLQMNESVPFLFSIALPLCDTPFRLMSNLHLAPVRDDVPPCPAAGVAALGGISDDFS